LGTSSVHRTEYHLALLQEKPANWSKMSSAKSGKDSTRAERKAKKRKLENAIPDLPGEDYNATGLQNEVTSTRKGSDRPTKKRKHEDHTQELISHNDTSEKAVRRTEVKSKKPRRITSSDELNEESNSVDEKTMAGVDAKSGSALLLEIGEPPRKTKKERKAERKIAEAAKASESAGTALSNPVLPPDSQSTPAAGTGQVPTGKSKTNNRNREKQRKSKQNNEPMEKTDGKAPRFIVFIG
jgi:nucleolar protein 6